MRVDVLSRRCLQGGEADVSLGTAVQASSAINSGVEALCQRLSRLDSELEKARAHVGSRGELGKSSLIELTGGTS
jgi:hypothetical protein